MKTYVKLICASIAALLMAFSCTQEVEEQITFSSDPAALTDVPCKDPSDQVLNLTTNANWIVITPTWVKADPIFGSGNAIVSFTEESTYINEKTDVAPRSGEIVFSGGGKSYTVPISQLGYTVPYDPSASIGGIPDVDEFMKFVEAVNNNDGTSRWQNASKEIELLADLTYHILVQLLHFLFQLGFHGQRLQGLDFSRLDQADGACLFRHDKHDAIVVF